MEEDNMKGKLLGKSKAASLLARDSILWNLLRGDEVRSAFAKYNPSLAQFWVGSALREHFWAQGIDNSRAFSRIQSSKRNQFS